MRNLAFPSVEAPFGEPIPSIHLPEAPLDLVVVQAQFPAILAVDAQSGRDLVAQFQDRIRDSYPLLQEAHEVAIVFSEPEFAPTASGGLLFRFSSTDHAWQISLSRSFVALQTNSYTERVDLIQRFTVVLDALAATLHPTMCERLGVRYSSHIADPLLLARLPEFIRPEIVGAVVATDAATDPVRRVHMVTDCMYAMADASLRARWGIIPAGTTIDANIAPAATERFLIDIDVFSIAPIAFDPAVLVDRVSNFSDRQYRYFRWMVTPEYLVAHGARP
jgi:uncharacterized protein (TIGR04255 family)